MAAHISHQRLGYYGDLLSHEMARSIPYSGLFIQTYNLEQPERFYTHNQQKCEDEFAWENSLLKDLYLPARTPAEK